MRMRARGESEHSVEGGEVGQGDQEGELDVERGQESAADAVDGGDAPAGNDADQPDAEILASNGDVEGTDNESLELDIEGQVPEDAPSVEQEDAAGGDEADQPDAEVDAEVASENDVESYDEGNDLPPPPPPLEKNRKKKLLLVAAVGVVACLAIGIGLGLAKSNSSSSDEEASDPTKGSDAGDVAAADGSTMTSSTAVPETGAVEEEATTATTTAATAEAVATTASSTEPPPAAVDEGWPEPAETYDAVIVGAGWAGIKAAETLVDSGITNILVLEANDYVGGRSKSYNSDDSYNNPDMIGDASNVPYDLGSEWLYNTGSEKEDSLVAVGYLDSILDAPKDTAVPMEKGYAFYIERKDGTTTLLEESGEWIKDIWGGFLQFRDNRFDLLQGLSYAEATDQYIDRWNWNDDESLQFLNLMETAIEMEFSGDSSQIDVQDLELFPPGYEMNTHYVSVPGIGFGNVAADYAQPVLNYIRLNARVMEMDSTGGGAPTIRFEENGTKKAVEAETVLITASVGALKAGVIDFIPTLPEWKQEGIDNMGFGIVNKCSLSWENDEDLVWPEDKYWFYLITKEDETSGAWTQFWNGSQFKKKPFLTAYAGGEDAKEWEAKSDEEILERVMGNLRAMFPDIKEPDDYLITRWGQEETIQGAYSFPMPGRVHSDDAEVLARRVGRLYFAGEATDTGGGWGTTMGAWNTGVETAEAMAQRLQNL